MKSIYQHSLLYLLSFQILIASVGIPLHKRSCAMLEMDDQVALFSPPPTCCEEMWPEYAQDQHHTKDKAPPVDPCCDFSADFFKVDFKVVIQPDLDQQVSFFGLLPFVPSYEHSFLAAYLEKEIHLYTDSSPPNTGRQIILLKQSLLI